jgi:hypothetical protein
MKPPLTPLGTDEGSLPLTPLGTDSGRERERGRIYGKDGDGQSPLESQHYRKDRIYGKDGEDVTAKLASLLLRTCSCRRVSRDIRSRR